MKAVSSQHSSGFLKLALLVLFFTTGFQSAIAAQSVNAIDGVAMDGFDVVAYFKIGEPRKGSPEYSLQYKDQTWQFSSPGNLADFKASPEIYEPKFNGWCAFAVSEGYSADVDFIDGWSILDGKLYLNWNASTRDQFLKEQKVRKNLADQRWPVVESGLKAGWLKVHRHSDYPQIGIKHPQQLEN